MAKVTKRDEKDVKRPAAKDVKDVKAKVAPEMKVKYGNVVVRGRRLGLPYAEVNYTGGKTASQADLQRVSDELARRHPGFLFQLSTLGNHGWRTGVDYAGDVGAVPRTWDPAIMYSMQDEDPNDFLSYKYVEDDLKTGTVKRFFIAAKPLAGGADDEHNDCLFDEILVSYGKTPFPKGAPPTAEALKKALKLKRDDLVPLNLLRVVEYLYHVGISITGDAVRLPSNAYQRKVNLVLSVGHYSSPRAKALEHRATPGVPYIWRKNPDGTATITSAKGEKSLPFGSNQFWDLLKRDDTAVWRHAKPVTAGHPETAVQQLARWCTERDALLEASGGTVDMFITPTPAEAAQRELRLLSTTVFKPLPIEQQVWVADAMAGGLIDAKKGFEGKATQYDVNSMYPSVLFAKSQTWPTGPGEFQTLYSRPVAKTSGKAYWPYGIYRMKPLPKCAGIAQYRTHASNVYTHYDLEAYQAATGIVPLLLNDGKPNALVWQPTQRASGSIIFGAFIKKWYGAKQAGAAGAKEFLTCLWGALGQRASKKHIHKGELRISDDEVIIAWYPAPGVDRWEVVTRPATSLFIGPAPAIGCFLTARARQTFAAMFRPYLPRVVRIHTDSFTLSAGAAQPAVSTGLGGLKLEHSGVVSVRHVNATTWTGCTCKKCAK